MRSLLPLPQLISSFFVTAQIEAHLLCSVCVCAGIFSFPFSFSPTRFLSIPLFCSSIAWFPGSGKFTVPLILSFIFPTPGILAHTHAHALSPSSGTSSTQLRQSVVCTGPKNKTQKRKEKNRPVFHVGLMTRRKYAAHEMENDKNNETTWPRSFLGGRRNTKTKHKHAVTGNYHIVVFCADILLLNKLWKNTRTQWSIGGQVAHPQCGVCRVCM